MLALNGMIAQCRESILKIDRQKDYIHVKKGNIYDHTTKKIHNSKIYLYITIGSHTSKFHQIMKIDNQIKCAQIPNFHNFSTNK